MAPVMNGPAARGRSAKTGRAPGLPRYRPQTAHGPFERTQYASHPPAPAVVPDLRAVPADLAAATRSDPAPRADRHRYQHDASAAPDPREPPGEKNTRPAQPFGLPGKRMRLLRTKRWRPRRRPGSAPPGCRYRWPGRSVGLSPAAGLPGPRSEDRLAG